MQTIDATQSKTLQFEVDINGVNSSDLNGLLQFVIEDVYYGFPVSISENLIEVEVPPLSSIVKNSLVSDSVIECQLSVFGKGFYLEPWKNKIQIHVPIQMEAKMVSNYSNNVTLKEDKKEKIEVKKRVKKEEINETEDNLDMELDDDRIIEESIELEDYNSNLKNTVKEKSKENALVENVVERKTNTKEIRKRKINLMKNIIKEEVYFIKTGKRKNIIKENNKLIKELRKTVRLKLIEQLKSKQKKKKTIVKESGKNKDPKVLMESLGMKSEKVQERMLEKAESMGGKDGIYDTIKKMLELTSKR